MNKTAKHADELRAIRSQRDSYQAKAASFRDERDLLKAQVEELRGALQTLLDFNIASGNDRTSAGGVGPFAYAGTEYSPITQAKAALKVSQ